MMKALNILLVLAIVLFSSCEEIPHAIDNSTSFDSIYVSSSVPSSIVKKVLVEEWTGVACNNCKDGHEQLSEIYTSSGGRVVAVGMHLVDGFSDPARFPGKSIDLRPADLDLSTVIGEPGSLPAAIIDRKIFDGEAESIVGLNKWSGLVEGALDSIPIVDLSVNVLLYDSVNNQVVFETEATFTETVSENVAITILIAEDDVAAPQLDGATWLKDYEQPHVLRRYVTPNIGKSLNGDINRGTTFLSRFTEDIDPSYDENNLEIVAFVHYQADPFKGYAVMQVANAYVGEH